MAEEEPAAAAPGRDVDAGPRAGPLSGVVVADFSRVLAGPLATMTLGDLGADVIKVEQPGIGDVTREWGPPFTDDGFSTYYLSVNRNKRSVSLDLATEQGLADAQALTDRADVVVENFRAGFMQDRGLGYDVVGERNPGVVYCSLSAFGSDASEAPPGFDLLIQAMSGLMSLTGAEDGPPTKVGVAVVDVLTGLQAANGIQAALRERDRTGRGQRVEVDLMSSALAGLVNQASAYVAGGEVPERLGNRHPSITPYETFPTATESLAVAPGNDRQFAALCRALERDGLSHQARFASNAARVRNRDELAAELGAVFAGGTRDGWIARLRAEGVPCGPVNDVAEAFDTARELGQEPMTRVTGDDGRIVEQVRNPMGLSETPVTYRGAPPRLDEHGAEVRSWLRRSRTGEGERQQDGGRDDGWADNGVRHLRGV